MRRYGRDYETRSRGYDRGYRHGWGMTGLYGSIMHGPDAGRDRYERHERYDRGYRGAPRRPRPAPMQREPRRPFEPNPHGRFHVPRGDYPREWR